MCLVVDDGPRLGHVIELGAEQPDVQQRAVMEAQNSNHIL